MQQTSQGVYVRTCVHATTVTSKNRSSENHRDGCLNWPLTIYRFVTPVANAEDIFGRSTHVGGAGLHGWAHLRKKMHSKSQRRKLNDR